VFASGCELTAGCSQFAPLLTQTSESRVAVYPWRLGFEMPVRVSTVYARVANAFRNSSRLVFMVARTSPCWSICSSVSAKTGVLCWCDLAIRELKSEMLIKLKGVSDGAASMNSDAETHIPFLSSAGTSSVATVSLIMLIQC
jgi:hypothetical protein